MPSFKSWPERMAKNWFFLIRYGMKTREAAFGALSISALLLFPSTSVFLQRLKKLPPERMMRATQVGAGPLSSTL